MVAFLDLKESADTRPDKTSTLSDHAVEESGSASASQASAPQASPLANTIRFSIKLNIGSSGTKED